MTIQEAYAKGFRKVAKAHGVDPQELYKYAKDKEKSHIGAIAGGGVGGLAGLLSGDLARHGFKGTAIEARPVSPSSRIEYRLGAKIREALGRRRYLKLMGSGKGKAISAALVGVPTLAGLAGGAGLGHTVDSLFNKDK